MFVKLYTKNYMNRVFVLSKSNIPLMPCRPSRARYLLKMKKAIVVKIHPFTIKMLQDTGDNQQAIQYKTDPGSKITGLALVADYKEGKCLIWAANLSHKLTIKYDLLTRRQVRNHRRQIKTRYRPARFKNRTRTKGWIPPSLKSRVDNITSWLSKIIKLCPVTDVTIETVRFDMQKMMNSEIRGIEYQQGTLAGYDVREYILQKYNRTCVYCDATNVLFEIDHVIPRSRGGSDRVSNLVLACVKCNKAKDNIFIEHFVTSKTRLAKIKSQLTMPLKDAATVNTTRNAIMRELSSIGLPVEIGTGSRTKMNRIKQGYPKDHWVDAACVGESGEKVRIHKNFKPLNIKAMGRGSRLITKIDKYGFPIKGSVKGATNINGIHTGDLVKVVQPKGKYIGKYIERVSSINTKRKYIAIKVNGKFPWFPPRLVRIIQKKDGYRYSF